MAPTLLPVYRVHCRGKTAGLVAEHMLTEIPGKRDIHAKRDRPGNAFTLPTYPARAGLVSQQHHSTMLQVKQRSNLAHELQEQRYAKALKGLEDGTYKTLGKAAVSNELSKSSLGHRRNGRRSHQEARQDEQIFCPAAEKAVVKVGPEVRQLWILTKGRYFGGLGSSSSIGKGSVHVFSWYDHITAENKDACWAVSLKGWTDSKIGYGWLINVYDPISKVRCPLPHLRVHGDSGGHHNAQAQKLREALKKIPPRKEGRRQMRDSTNLAGVMAGGAIKRIEERDQKDQEKAAQKAAKGASRTRKVVVSANGQFAAPQELAGP